MKQKSKPHKCKFEYASHGGDGKGGFRLGFYCYGCHMDKERLATPEEAACIKAELDNGRYAQIHKTWNLFCRKFWKKESIGKLEWKWYGWDLIQRVEKWAKGRSDVKITSVDDDSYMSSTLVLIEHRTSGKFNQYHGTTVVFIPQSVGDPAFFFMYPGHRDELIKALREIEKSSKPFVKAQKKDEARWRKIHSKWKP